MKHKKTNHLIRDTRGMTATEYAAVLAVLLALVMGAAKTLGGGIGTAVHTASQRLTSGDPAASAAGATTPQP